MSIHAAAPVVSDHWQDEWLRLNWHTTPETIEYAFGLGIITLRQYLDATENMWRGPSSIGRSSRESLTR
jgi:hypothetical protein